MKPKIYLGIKYSGTEDQMHQAYSTSEKLTAHLLKHNHPAFSPIVHCHWMAKNQNMPQEYFFWQHFNKTWLDWADILQVVKTPNWQESIGLNGEIDYATEKGKIVRINTPSEITKIYT